MKKMMTNIKTLAALLMASATFAACSSDDNTIDQQPAQPAGQQVYTMTVNAQKGDDAATTRALALDDKTLNATWATSEHIYVKNGTTWATGSLQPQTDGTTATLKGSLSGVTIAATDVLTLQFPRSGELDYTGQVGTLADIAAKYDYATATVTVASVSATGNINPTEATTTFQNQQAIVKFTLIDKADGTTSLDATELIVNDGTTDYTVTPASGTSEIYVAIPGISEKTVTLTATVGSDTYTYEKANVTFTNGQYYEITVKMNKEINSKDPSDLDPDADICKLYATDGKIYNNQAACDAASVTPIGIVVYIGSNTGEASPYTHGLVMALKEASYDGTNLPTWAANDEGYHTDETYLSNIQNISDAQTKDKSGLTNTAKLVGCTGSGHNHRAAKAANEYVAYKKDGSVAAVPATSTKWFLPSAAQWCAAIGNSGGVGKVEVASLAWGSMSTTMFSTMNDGLATAYTSLYTSLTSGSSSWFWTSCEYSLDYAVVVSVKETTVQVGSRTKYNSSTRVRPFLAF